MLTLLGSLMPELSGVEQHEGRERGVLEGTKVCSLLLGDQMSNLVYRS